MQLLSSAARAEMLLSLVIINYGEVLYIIQREQGERAALQTVESLDNLPIVVVEASRDLTFAAARVKAQYRVSYADAFAIALAQQTRAMVLTGDPEFRSVTHLIDIEWLPSNR